MQPRQTELGRLVADRSYRWHYRGKTGTLVVRIGIPRRDLQPGGEWLCPVRISGWPRAFGLRPTTQPIYGVDKLQALILALGYLHSMVVNARPILKLTWFDTSDLGLPDVLSSLTGAQQMVRRPPRTRATSRA